jgi:hypothetical protein
MGEGHICYGTFNSFGEDDPQNEKQEEIKNSQSSQQSSLALKKEDSPQMKDEQINHSKIVRDIEKKLTSMQIDFNIAIII